MSPENVWNGRLDSSTMRVTYDAEVDSAYIYLGELAADVVRQYPAPDSEAFMINLDFDAAGRLLGLEIIGASAKLPVGFLERFANRTVEPT
jgi:uncharacterized protein YuzE